MKFLNLFEPDILIPQQFATRSRSHTQMPERRLSAAVLMNAFLDLKGMASAPERADEFARTQLLAWFASRDSTWPFSFESVCEQLDLNPERIRSRLKPLTDRCRRSASQRGKCGRGEA
jgi:hypothetical protein